MKKLTTNYKTKRLEEERETEATSEKESATTLGNKNALSFFFDTLRNVTTDVLQDHMNMFLSTYDVVDSSSSSTTTTKKTTTKDTMKSKTIVTNPSKQSSLPKNQPQQDKKKEPQHEQETSVWKDVTFNILSSITKNVMMATGDALSDVADSLLVLTTVENEEKDRKKDGDDEETVADDNGSSTVLDDSNNDGNDAFDRKGVGDKECDNGSNGVCDSDKTNINGSVGGSTKSRINVSGDDYEIAKNALIEAFSNGLRSFGDSMATAAINIVSDEINESILKQNDHERNRDEYSIDVDIGIGILDDDNNSENDSNAASSCSSSSKGINDSYRYQRTASITKRGKVEESNVDEEVLTQFSSPPSLSSSSPWSLQTLQLSSLLSTTIFPIPTNTTTEVMFTSSTMVSAMIITLLLLLILVVPFIIVRCCSNIVNNHRRRRASHISENEDETKNIVKYIHENKLSLPPPPSSSSSLPQPPSPSRWRLLFHHPIYMHIFIATVGQIFIGWYLRRSSSIDLSLELRRAEVKGYREAIESLGRSSSSAEPSDLSLSTHAITSSKTTTAFESTFWINSILREAWRVPRVTCNDQDENKEESRSDYGGIEPFLSTLAIQAIGEAMGSLGDDNRDGAPFGGLGNLNIIALRSLTLGSNPPIIRGVEIVQRRRGEKQEEDEMDSSYIDKKLKSSWVPSSLPLRIDLDLPMDEFSLVLDVNFSSLENPFIPTTQIEISKIDIRLDLELNFILAYCNPPFVSHIEVSFRGGVPPVNIRVAIVDDNSMLGSVGIGSTSIFRDLLQGAMTVLLAQYVSPGYFTITLPPGLDNGDTTQCKNS